MSKSICHKKTEQHLSKHIWLPQEFAVFARVCFGRLSISFYKNQRIVLFHILFSAVLWELLILLAEVHAKSVKTLLGVNERMLGTEMISSCSGPVLSRFDRFLLTGHRATPTKQHKFTFSSKLFVCSAGVRPSVFKVFWETITVLNFFPTVSQNTV